MDDRGYQLLPIGASRWYKPKYALQWGIDKAGTLATFPLCFCEEPLSVTIDGFTCQYPLQYNSVTLLIPDDMTGDVWWVVIGRVE